MKITFLGAASEVTGSQHLIETADLRILLDCGFFQGPRAKSREKNETFHCDPKNLDAVILSHAHIDHCGNLPRLYKMGFRGPVFCTDATADIAEMMLLDSAKIQFEDAKYLSRKLKGQHPPIEPLYSKEDVLGLVKLFQPCSFSKWHETIGDELRVRFHPAGHILGSAISEIDIKDGRERKTIVFTGDLGRRGMPLLKDPTPVEGADVVICESLYGSRIHPPSRSIKDELERILKKANEQKGRVVIPAFSLGRTQQVVYFLNELFNEDALPRMPIYVDSPLATRLTKIFRRYDETLDKDVQETLVHDDDIFGFESLTYVGSQKESMELNRREGPFVVISASGMCENGRVVHHLKHAMTKPENIIALMGYQAPNTAGRRIANKERYVRIFGRELPLKAEVHQFEGLSAHADVEDLKWWFEQSTKRGHFGHVFLVHGEPHAGEALAKVIDNHCDHPPIIPKRLESFEV